MSSVRQSGDDHVKTLSEPNLGKSKKTAQYSFAPRQCKWFDKHFMYALHVNLPQTLPAKSPTLPRKRRCFLVIRDMDRCLSLRIRIARRQRK